MPIDYDRIMLTYKKKPQAGSTNTVGSQNRTAVSTSQQGGGIDWDRIMQEYGMRTPKAGTGSTPPLERGIYAPKLPGGTLAVPARSAGRFQMAALSGGNGYTTEAYGESLKKRIAEINEHLTVYANRGRIVGQVATKADADAWTAQKKALENEYAAWERGMYAAGQEKALSALPDEDLKLIDRYLDEKQFAANPVQTTLDPLGVSDSDSATYRKLLQKYGRDKARSLIEYREQQKNESRQTAINKTVADYASSGAWQAVAASAASIVTNALSTPGMIASAVKAGVSPNSHARVDINNPLNTMQNFTRSSRGGVSSAILGGDPENASFGRQAGNLLYQTLMSGLDSAVAMTIGGKSANYLLGATAATNAMQDITERGGTLEQAVTGGIAAGVFECIFEKYSIGNFYKLKETANVRGIKDLLLNMGKSALVNASEEGATELANVLYDSIMLGDISNVSIRLRELMAVGMTESEAKRAMAAELGAQIGESALSGALMGLFFGGVGSLENYVRGSRASSGSTESPGVNVSKPTALDEESLVGPRPITLPTAEEVMNRQAARNTDVQYSLEEIDGRIMPVIDTKNDTRKFDAAETYLKTLVDTQNPFATILSDAQPVYIGKDLPGEYRSSENTKGMNVILRRVKMQAATNLDEMLLLAENGEWRENVKAKHSKDAANGWYRYDTEFAIPGKNIKGEAYNSIYSGTLLIRNDADGKSYLYDLLDIKEKKTVAAPASSTAKRRSEVSERVPSSTTESANTAPSSDTAKIQSELNESIRSSSDPTISQPDTGVNPSIRNRNTIDTVAGPRPITLPTAEETMNRQSVQQTQPPLPQVPGMLPTAEQEMIQRRARSTEPLPITLPGGLDSRTETAYDESNHTITGGATYDGQTRRAGDLFDGSRERDAGGSTGGQAGILAEGAGRNPARNLQAGRAIARQDRINALRLEKVSTASLGIKKGTDDAVVAVYPQTLWDHEMTSTAARIREESGLDVIYFTGSLQLAARRGTALAKGAITDGRIYIQADNPQYTVAQIGDHELYHHIARSNLGLIYAIRKAISERYSETDFEKIVSRYIESYSGVYEGENALNRIFEEIFADAYAGINAFGVRATRYTDTVRQITEERTGATPISTRGEAETDVSSKKADPTEQYALRLPTAEDDIRYSLTVPPGRGAQQGTPDAPYDDRGERWDGTFHETGNPAAVQPIAVEAADAGEPPRAVLPTVQEPKNRFQVLREQSAVPREERLRAAAREDFTATPAINRLGIRIEGSVADYAGAEGLQQRDAAAKSLRREIARAERRMRATDAEKNFASGITAGVYTADDIPRSMDTQKVLDLAEYYMAERALGLDMIRERRRDINAQLDERMDALFQDADKYKPSSPVALYHNTPQRNMRKIFGEELGERINREIFDPVARNESERLRFVNRQFDEVRAFEDSKGRMRELTRQESALVQQVIEGRAIAEQVAAMEMGEAVRRAAEDVANGGSLDDTAREHHLSLEERRTAEKYSRWLEAQKLLRSDKIDAVKIENAVAKYRERFDAYYDAINDFLVVHGYEPIGFIKGYAPHMQAAESKKTLEKALQAFGIQTDVSALPTSIAGLTSEYKPGKKWNPYFLSRETDTTTYDIVSAFESYVSYLSDVLYHTDDIMRLRRMTRHFRKAYSREEIRAKLDWLRTLRNAPSEDKAAFLRAEGKLDHNSVLSQNAIESALDDFLEEQLGMMNDNTKYGNFVSWLDNYANVLAGKQSVADRGFEAEYGRTVLNWGNRLTRAFARAQVAGNLSSALNQTAQLPMIFAENGGRNTARALWDIAGGNIRRAGFSTESDLLTGKKGVRYIVHTPGEMLTTALFKPAEFVDGFVSTIAVRGAYYKALKQGMDHAQAMRAADQYGTEVMASRLKGVKPTAFESKNPLSQMVHMFQIEAINSWEHILHDLPRDFHQIAAKQGKGKAALALAGVIVKALLSALLLNRVAEELYGGTPAPFDILGLTANFIASGEGLSTNAYLRTMIDNAWETYTGERLFDTEELDPDRAFDWGSASSDLLYNAMNDAPFARNVSGLLGLGDQTLPLPNLLGGGKALVEAVGNSGVLSEETGEALAGLAAEFAPGGRQMKKTMQGVKTMRKGGRIYGYGENERLQYPVEDTAGNWVKAVMFGNTGLGETSSFYASGLSGLSKEQTVVYRDLVARGADGGEVYDTIQAMRATETPEEKRNALTASSLTDREKAALYSGIVGDGRDEEFDILLRADLSWGDIMEAYNRYAALEKEEGQKASEKATEYAYWVDRSRHTSKQKELIKENFKFYAQIPAEADRYGKFTDAGLSTDDAYELANALAKLTPEPGKAQVSDYQRYETIIGSGLNTRDQISAIGSIMGTELLTESGNPSRYAKLLAALDAGVQLRDWLAASHFAASAKTDYDANGKEVKGAKEKVVEYIDGMDVSDEVKDALYLCWYAESELSKTPWHGGFFKWPSFSNDAWASFPKIELPRY